MTEWKVLEPKEEYIEADSITMKLLKIRGIKNKDKFLEPKESDLNSPWNLSNMSEAVDKICDAIRNNLKIGIYADIDADGVTSATIMYKYLKNYGIDSILLYHQRKESHGVIVSNVPIDIDLLIIVDSSTNSVKQCEELCLHMDIVVLDHHDIECENTYAIIVNPQGNDYSNKQLSGAGVVFQTCRAIDEMFDESYSDDYVDICAVGLIGDVMDVTDPETRYLIYKGLLKMHENCDINIMAVLKSLKKEYKPNAATIGFYVVPFINAIIRLGKIQDVIEILTTDDLQRLKELIKACGGKNEERKELQSDIVEKIHSFVDLTHKIIIVDVTSLKTNKTLNGLIANSVAQKYQKPTLVVSLDLSDDILKGSGRGYGNAFDFKEVLLNTGLFENVAGHSNAFGVEVKPQNLDMIHEVIDNQFEDLKQEYKIEADMIIDVDDITWDFAYEIQRLSFITGKGFSDPLFIIRGLTADNIKLMKDVHMKFTAEDLECVKFNASPEEIQSVEDSLCIDILGSVGVNSWYNFGTKETVKTKQVMLKDFIAY